MANERIKNYAAGKGVKLWQIADEMGIQDSSLSRKFRHEFTDEEQKKTLQIIDALAAKKCEVRI